MVAGDKEKNKPIEKRLHNMLALFQSVGSEAEWHELIAADDLHLAEFILTHMNTHSTPDVRLLVCRLTVMVAQVRRRADKRRKRRKEETIGESRE